MQNKSQESIWNKHHQHQHTDVTPTTNNSLRITYRKYIRYVPLPNILKMKTYSEQAKFYINRRRHKMVNIYFLGFKIMHNAPAPSLCDVKKNNSSELN